MEAVLLFAVLVLRCMQAVASLRGASAASPRSAAIYGSCTALYGGHPTIYGGSAAVYGGSAPIHGVAAAVHGGSGVFHTDSAAMHAVRATELVWADASLGSLRRAVLFT
eukprot:3280460-Rhodomonas_salina.1